MDESEGESKKKARKVTVKNSKVKPVEISEQRGSVRTKLRFNELPEESYDSSKQMEKLRETLLKEYSDVFKTELTPEDRINMPPVVIETVKN